MKIWLPHAAEGAKSSDKGTVNLWGAEGRGQLSGNADTQLYIVWQVPARHVCVERGSSTTLLLLAHNLSRTDTRELFLPNIPGIYGFDAFQRVPWCATSRDMRLVIFRGCPTNCGHPGVWPNFYAQRAPPAVQEIGLYLPICCFLFLQRSWLWVLRVSVANVRSKKEVSDGIFARCGRLDKFSRSCIQS